VEKRTAGAININRKEVEKVKNLCYQRRSVVSQDATWHSQCGKDSNRHGGIS